MYTFSHSIVSNIFISFSPSVFVCPSVILSVCFLCLSVSLSVCLSVSLSINLSVCLHVFLSVYLCAYLSILLSYCLSACLSVRPSVFHRFIRYPSIALYKTQGFSSHLFSIKYLYSKAFFVSAFCKKGWDFTEAKISETFVFLRFFPLFKSFSQKK